MNNPYRTLFAAHGAGEFSLAGLTFDVLQLRTSLYRLLLLAGFATAVPTMIVAMWLLERMILVLLLALWGHQHLHAGDVLQKELKA